ncbi:MAG: hypothetical protein R2843_15865 [Thermomicrobiales bacterium]
MFTGARLLLESPTDYAAKVVIFGAIDAFAYQIIAFGIAYATFQTSGWGLAAAIASFAISWGFRDLISTSSATVKPRSWRSWVGRSPGRWLRVLID